jgi:hypothetical protein
VRADYLDEAFATAAELTKTRLLNIPSRQPRLVNAKNVVEVDEMIRNEITSA